MAFDLPTQMGYDSDDGAAMGEVGRVGVAIDSIEDMLVLFDGIPLDRVSTSMTINSTASTLLALYVAVARRQGVDPKRLRGTIQNDLLKEYIARGTYIFPPRPSMRIITDIFAWCAAEVPEWNTISISGYHIREAGSTAAQEIAFTLADGIAYVDAALAAGLDVDDFAGQLSFFFNAHNNFLEEVAKFRAARRLWARIMRDRFGAKNPKSWMLRFHTQTAGSTLTAQQVDNNVVRVAIQLALPSGAAARLALRTQQVIASESGVADFVDPLGGSWAIEQMTDELEQSAERYIAEIDALGGMVPAIERGYPQREIQNAAYRAQVEQERGDRQVVGVNCYTEGDAPQADLLKVDPRLEAEQVGRLRALRAARDPAAASAALDRLVEAAKGTANLMPRILDAVEANVTLGEISHALRRIYGEYQETLVV